MTDFLTVPEAADLIRVSECTVHRKLRKGEWDDFAWKAGKAWRIEKGPLLEHLRKKPLRESNPDPMPPTTRRARFEAEMKKAMAANG